MSQKLFDNCRERRRNRAFKGFWQRKRKVAAFLVPARVSKHFEASENVQICPFLVLSIASKVDSSDARFADLLLEDRSNSKKLYLPQPIRVVLLEGVAKGSEEYNASYGIFATRMPSLFQAREILFDTMDHDLKIKQMLCVDYHGPNEIANIIRMCIDRPFREFSERSYFVVGLDARLLLCVYEEKPKVVYVISTNQIMRRMNCRSIGAVVAGARSENLEDLTSWVTNTVCSGREPQVLSVFLLSFFKKKEPVSGSAKATSSSGSVKMKSLRLINPERTNSQWQQGLRDAAHS